MRISIVLGPFQRPPPHGFGAVEKVWWALAEEFVRCGHEVHVIAKSPSRDDGRTAQPQARFLRGFDATGILPIDLAKDLLYAAEVVASLPRSDVVITNSFWLPALLWPLKKWKGRLAVHVGRFPKGQMWLYQGADLIHTVSSPVAAAIERECPRLRDRIVVLGYPIDTQIYHPRQEKAQRKPSRSVLYVGRIHPEKGVHLLVEAFESVLGKCPDVSLAIVGPFDSASGGGGSAYLRKLTDRAKGLPITFESPIADEALLAARYREADVFCYPSLAERGETFGRAVLEAMASGLPSVVSGLRCFSDFLTSGIEGLVFDHNCESPRQALANAITKLLQDEPLAASMAERARERALNYGMPCMARSYLAMLDTVVSRNSRGERAIR